MQLNVMRSAVLSQRITEVGMACCSSADSTSDRPAHNIAVHVAKVRQHPLSGGFTQLCNLI